MTNQQLNDIVERGHRREAHLAQMQEEVNRIHARIIEIDRLKDVYSKEIETDIAALRDDVSGYGHGV